MTTLFSSCQAITYTILVNQPYNWYAGIFIGLMVVKLVSTFTRSSVISHHSTSRVPKKITHIFQRHHFPVQRVRCLRTTESLAFTSGLLQPTITLSLGLVRQLTPKELEAVILHEIYHAQHYHPLRVALTKVLRSMLALLPIVDDMAEYYYLLLETQADCFAHSHQHSARFLKSALAKLLISPVPQLALGFSQYSFDQRVNCLATYRWPSLRFKPAKVFLSALMMLASWWYVQQWQSAKALETEYDLSTQCTLTQCVSNCVSETWFTPAPNYTPDVNQSSLK